MEQNIEIKKINVDEIVSYFKEEGLKISKEEAEIIIHFISILTITTLKHFLDE